MSGLRQRKRKKTKFSVVELERKWAEDVDNHHLLGFNLKNELFFELALPEGVFGFRGLTNLGDCLSFLNMGDLDPSGYFVYEMWMMKSYGVKDSWIKLYSISENEEPFRIGRPV